jgi:serine/threonine protein kinase
LFLLQAEVYLSATQRENKRESTQSSPTNLPENDQSQEMRWMAPECIRDAEYTHKSDVWAMGIVIYEVIR